MKLPTFIILPSAASAAYALEHSILPIEVGAIIDWPHKVTYKSKVYFWCDKTGTHKVSGLPTACYKIADESKDERVWLQCNGEITED